MSLIARQQVRRWLEFVAKGAAESADFAIGGTVEMMYGRPPSGAFESDRGLVEYALAFANGEADRSQMQQYLDAGKRKLGNAAGSADNPAYLLLAIESGQRPPRTGAAARLLDAEVLEQRLQWLRELLAAVRRDKAQAAERYRAPARNHLKRMWSVPTVRASDGALRHVVVIEDSALLHSYVTLLLLGPLGSELCQCTLEGCSRYFLVKKPKTGRPQTLYCTREHMLAAHGKNATQRSADSRAKHKAARKPK